MFLFVLEKYLADMKEAKQQISEKSSAFDAENFKYNRLKVGEHSLFIIRKIVSETINKNMYIYYFTEFMKLFLNLNEFKKRKYNMITFPIYHKF